LVQIFDKIGSGKEGGIMRCFDVVCALRTALIIFALLVTTTAFAQVPEAVPVCVMYCGNGNSNNSNNGNNKEGNSSKGTEQHSLTTPSGSQPPPHMPPYSQAYLYSLFHDNNVPGKPLPWENTCDDCRHAEATIEAQALIDRWAAYQTAKDPELLQNWSHYLLKYSVKVAYSWESKEQMEKVLADLNKETIRQVRNTLLWQISKLEPFEYDSPELKNRKRYIVERSLDMLKNGDRQWDPEFGPPIIEMMYEAQLAGPPMVTYKANNTMRRLISLVEDGDLSKRDCNTWDSFCGKW
jgi:hypothetical protein